MTLNKGRTLRLAAAVLALGLVAAACGGDDADEGAGSATTAGADGAATTTEAKAAATTEAKKDLSGAIKIDGSSTVAPLMKLAAEDFQAENKGVTVTVGTSGTGGGFEKFCNGETDISNASRPIKAEETAKCEAKGIKPIEMLVANDALTVVVHPKNTWAKCLTVAELKKIWEPDSKINNWNQVNPSFPDKKLSLYGAGTDSGTFDYFTEAINGKAKASRTDYNPTEDDNVTVTGVGGDEGAMGYFGFSYFEENASKIKAVEIDGGKGKGCVAPSTEAVLDGSYAPLGRQLFMYVSDVAAKRPEIKAFVEFYADNSTTITEEALFVDLSADQKKTMADEVAKIVAS